MYFKDKITNSRFTSLQFYYSLIYILTSKPNKVPNLTFLYIFANRLYNMSFIKFITSKVFFKQIFLAVLTLVILGFLVLKWLDFTTNHGEFVIVPDLKGKSMKTAQIELNDKTLKLEIQDSANYNPKYPKFSVIDQQPAAGEQVKEDRKIYVTLNPSGYRKVAVPEVLNRTFRQVKPSLEALGFRIGDTTSIDNKAKGLVLHLIYKGDTIMPGKKLKVTSTIDIVIANGKDKNKIYSEEEIPNEGEASDTASESNNNLLEDN